MRGEKIMSVPLDLSLISQLLNEQRTQGDLNNLTKPGFFYVVSPTNTPNDNESWCHVINLVNYSYNEHTAENMRIFQIYINDHIDDNTVWYRQYCPGWSAWERFATATDLADYVTKNFLATTLADYYNKGVIDEKLGSKVNNSDLVADYYNKTDVDALINTINSQLVDKANYMIGQVASVSARFYDATGTVHSETVDVCLTLIVGGLEALVKLEKTHAHFTLQDDYPVNTKLTKIAISTEAFSTGQALPATITIKDELDTKIVATLDTDNSDREFFIYNVPTNLQTVPIAKGTKLDVFFLQ